MPKTIEHTKSSLFDWLLQRHVHEYFDVDGRPVGEGRSLAYKQIKTQFKSCPYAGSRYQHKNPMSVSALNSILPEWQNTLSLLSSLSQRYQAYQQTPITTYYDLALIAGMGVFLTDYMVLRAEKPLRSTHIPVLLSGLYKVCLGFQQATFLAMMNDHFKNDTAEKILPDTKGFYAYLEQQQLLIGEDEVCGGSEAMISRAYEAMKGEHPATNNKAVLSLITLDIDWQAYDTFTFHTSNLWRKAIFFVIQMRDFGIELQIPAIPERLRTTLNDYLARSFAELLQQQSGLAVEIALITLEESGRSLAEWVTVQEAFLREINYPLISPDTNEDSDNPILSPLAVDLVEQLSHVTDLSSYRALIVADISKQLARYEAFEAAVLHVFNAHLDPIADALGYTTVMDTVLMPEDLSLLYGKTLRDWPDVMRRSESFL
jgi:hypothetical protein